MIGVVSYLVFFVTVAAILSIAVLGLNLQWGNAGLFNGGVAAFIGAGAYGVILLGSPPKTGEFGGFDVPYPLALLGGMAAAGLLAWIVGIATQRLRHDYFAIATFGVAVAFESFVRNTGAFTGGARGLRGFERPFEEAFEQIFGDPLAFNMAFLALVLLTLILVYSYLRRLIASPFGRLLRAIREDEVAAIALGKTPARLRLISFIAGAVIMGLAGGLYGSFYAFVSPQDVQPILTFQIWAMLIVGGAGNARGAVFGAFLIWAVWTASGYIIASYAPVSWQLYAGTLQYVLIGAIIVGTLLWRPQGLLPEKLVVSQTTAGADN